MTKTDCPRWPSGRRSDWVSFAGGIGRVWRYDRASPPHRAGAVAARSGPDASRLGPDSERRGGSARCTSRAVTSQNASASRPCSAALSTICSPHSSSPDGRRSKLSNLGGRYEWGAAPLAEDHFQSHRSATGFTLLVAKINAHVAFEEIPTATETSATYRLGVWDRYGRDSTSCGALNSPDGWRTIAVFRRPPAGFRFGGS